MVLVGFSLVPPNFEALFFKAKNAEHIAMIIASFDENSLKSYLDYVQTINPVNPNRMKRISSKFGMRFHPIDKYRKPHHGLDISGKIGLPIHAGADGKVILIKHSRAKVGYGNQIKLEHNYGFQTRYAHLEKILVKPNQKLKKGDIIGLMGNTGKSTGSHLHYEIIKNGKPVNPEPFFNLLN